MVEVPVPDVVVPPEGLDIWGKFWDLRRFKDAETRITPREIADYRDLYETEIDQSEIRILCEMDRQFAAIRAEEMAFNEERRRGNNG